MRAAESTYKLTQIICKAIMTLGYVCLEMFVYKSSFV